MAIDEFFYTVGTGDYDVASIPAIVRSDPNDKYPKAMCLLKLCADRGSKCGLDDINEIEAAVDEDFRPMARFWYIATLAAQCDMLSPEDVDKLVDMAIRSNTYDSRAFFASTDRIADPDDERFLSWPHYTSFLDALPWVGVDAMRLYLEVEDSSSAKCGKISLGLKSGTIAPTFAKAKDMAEEFVGANQWQFRLRVYRDFCEHGVAVFSDPGVFGIPFESPVYDDALRVACDFAKPRLEWARTVHHAAYLVDRGLATTAEEVFAKFRMTWPVAAKAMYNKGLKTPPGRLPNINDADEYLAVCVSAHRSGIKLDWKRDRMDRVHSLTVHRALFYLAQLYHAGFRPEPFHVDLKRMDKDKVEQALLFFMRAGMDYVTATNAVAELTVDTTRAKAIIAFHETRQRRVIWDAYTFVYPDHAKALVKKREVDDAQRTLPELPQEVFRLIASKMSEPVLERVRFP
jgi:hypothetical protein